MLACRWVDPVVTWLNRVWATETTLEYFRDGHFSWMSPWASTVEARDERPGLDCIYVQDAIGPSKKPWSPMMLTPCLLLPVAVADRTALRHAWAQQRADAGRYRQAGSQWGSCLNAK